MFTAHHSVVKIGKQPTCLLTDEENVVDSWLSDTGGKGNEELLINWRSLLSNMSTFQRSAVQRSAYTVVPPYPRCCFLRFRLLVFQLPWVNCRPKILNKKKSRNKQFRSFKLHTVLSGVMNLAPSHPGH